jgi:hypothetical protein
MVEPSFARRLEHLRQQGAADPFVPRARANVEVGMCAVLRPRSPGTQKMNPTGRPSSSASTAIPLRTVSRGPATPRPRSRADTPDRRAPARTPPRARGRLGGLSRWRGGSSSVTECGEEVVGAQVLKWVKTDARGTNVRHVRVVREHRLTQGEVAGGPGLGPPEVAPEKPVRAPLADAA